MAVFRFYRHYLNRCHRLKVYYALFFIVLAAGIFRLQVDLNIYKIQDPQIASTQSLKLLKTEFDEGLSSFFVFLRKDQQKLSVPFICEIQKNRGNLPTQVKVQSLLDLHWPVFKDNRLYYKSWAQTYCEGLGSAPQQNPIFDDSQLPWVGILTDRKQLDFAFNVEFNSDQDHWLNQYGEVQKFFRSFENSEVILYESGRAASQWFMKVAMQKDMWVNVFLIVSLMLFFRLFFGTWTSGLLYTFSLVVTILTILGLMGWLGVPIDMLNNSLFLITAVAATEDFIFLTLAQNPNWKSQKRIYLNYLSPSFWTSFTTAIGFFTLLLSPLIVLQRFGLWASIAVMVEFFVLFFIFPVYFPKILWYRKTQFQLHNWILRLSHLSLPPKIGKILALFSVLGMVGYYQLTINSAEETFKPEHLASRSKAYVFDSRGWEAPISILFPPGISEEVVQQINLEMRELPFIAKTLSYQDIEQFLLKDVPPYTHDQLQAEFKASPLNSRFSSPAGYKRILLFLDKMSLTNLNSHLAVIRGLCKTRCQPDGELVVFADVLSRLIDSLKESFLLSLVIVSLILWFLSRRMKKNPVPLVLSSLWGPLALYGVIWIFNFPIDFLSLTVGAILVGITGDNAIQFLYASRQRSIRVGIEKRALGTTVVSLVTVFGSLYLCLQSMLPTRNLGFLLFLGFLFSYFGDLFLLKTFVKDDKTPT